MLVTFSALTALCALAVQVQAISKVTRTGRYLYQEDGTRFYIKGIGYQMQGERHESEDNHFGEPGTFIDPLADAAACRRDLEHLRAASINTLRVYSVDSSLNHDECMRLFSDANIYVILDLTLPVIASIDRTQPSWSTNMLDVFIRTINTFEKYDNVIVYNIGNEVVDRVQSSLATLPFLKAVARDVKAYLKSINSDRLVGFGSTFLDSPGNSGVHRSIAQFLSCGSEETSIDIFGLNDYTWCGSRGSLDQSSYRADITQFADYNVVAYFSEYGCTDARPEPRPWTEVEVLLGEDMSVAWSGGVAFNYFPTAAVNGDFGVVTLSADNTTVTVSEEFTSLGERYGAFNGPNSPSRDSVAAPTYGTCVAPTGASNTLPGTPNNEACSCLLGALSCRPNAAAVADADLRAQLTGEACGLLSRAGGSCDELNGNGATGVYGRAAACGPDVKLAYAMSSFYEREGRNAQSCNFGGNASLNPGASPTVDAPAAAGTCVPSPNAAILPALSEPSSNSGSPNPAPSAGNDGGNNPPANNNRGNGASGSAVRIGAFAFVSAMSAFWVLA
ncbi:1,3-beta-glucanosyltransferase [Coprinopsis marcescibilis]|uniref:1,3-beta-glucanosyltransferase n=1 Tax=Coprinopsis marcescibilis TaxID=230819 RepID=A0A5C3KLJ5_COPMA|nr:1,3-beta-glucanosyltransferase [Coprinopsis marcescibilis]